MVQLKFSGSLIKTDVTKIKVHENYILCGIGAILHIFDIRSLKLLHKIKVFDGVRIYGIQINGKCDKVLFHAENKIKIFTMDIVTLRFREISSKAARDWILAAKWIDSDDNLVTVSMHNIVEYYTEDLELKESIACEERCILYCAAISYDHWKQLVVFSGTVFSKVLIWKPGCSENDELCKVSRRLSGHKGVLFSIFHKPGMEYICSTSDDRSAILWKFSGELLDVLDTNKEISLKMKMYGHTARVFGCQVLTNHVVSIGEDGFFIVWDLKGNMLRKVDAHQSGPIWSLDCSEDRNLIVTGGGDSAVTVFPIKPTITVERFELKQKEVPKRVVLLENNDFVVVTENGVLYQQKSDSDIFQVIGVYDECKSYSLLEVSSCRKRIALAGFRGHVYIFTLNSLSGNLELMVSHQILTKTRVFAVHWLNCNHILTCGLDGFLYLWRLHVKGFLLLHIAQLPQCKERWSTSACLCGKSLAVGDRRGNLHVFDLDNLEPKQTFKRTHNHLGITNVYFDHRSGILTTLGRNSTVRKFKYHSETETLESVSTDKLPFTWLASMVKEKDIISAFSGNDFVLWDYKTRRVLLEFPCGGGHRSWDFNYLHNIRYVYIKDKTINAINGCWDSVNPRNVVNSFHVNEINSLKCIKLDENIYTVSGGEDTILRISKFNGDGFETMNILKSHLSSIRCLNLYKLEEHSKFLLFSAGGRAQIILWFLDFESQTICNQLYSYYESNNDESEVRIMDLCSAKIKDELLLFAACSDGKIKIFSVENNELKLSRIMEYKLRCILKLALITCLDKTIVISMATDGRLVFWDLQEGCIFSEIVAHKSGINSIYFKELMDNSFVFLTGGDDNALSLNLFKFHLNDGKLMMDVIANYMNSGTHVAQVSGVYLDEEYFVTTSLDQKVVVFKYGIESNHIIAKYVGAYDSTISDAKGIEVFRSHNSMQIVLYGLGLEILNTTII